MLYLASIKIVARRGLEWAEGSRTNRVICLSRTFPILEGPHFKVIMANSGDSDAPV